jgi:hypothetical protein
LLPFLPSLLLCRLLCVTSGTSLDLLTKFMGIKGGTNGGFEMTKLMADRCSHFVHYF